jgi:hypothetical protein
MCTQAPIFKNSPRPRSSGEDEDHDDDAPMVEVKDQPTHDLAEVNTGSFGHLQDEPGTPAEKGPQIYFPARVCHALRTRYNKEKVRILCCSEKNQRYND